MTAPEPIQSHQPQSMFSTWLGVVLLFAFFGLLAMVVLRAAPRGDTYEQKRAKARVEKLEAAQKQLLTAQTSYGWVDKTKGVVRIPVAEAMKLTVAELADKKPAAANPIATPDPAAAPGTSPAPATSPAAAGPAVPAATATPVTTDKPSSVTGPDSEIRAQPAAAANPPNAPPATQPGPSTTPASSPPSATTKGQTSPSPSPSPSPPGTPLPVRGKTP